jgi:Alginate export
MILRRRSDLALLLLVAFSAPGDAEPLSIGLTLRERFESNDAPLFGVNGRSETSFEIQRLQVNADLHVDVNWNAFIELEDARAIAKSPIGPADIDPLDLRQAYVMYQHELGPGFFKVRVGRQEISFDLQRFVSVRDGPNVQQALDAVWVAWDVSRWKIHAFVSLPVEYERAHWFDDTQQLNDRFSLIRLERKLGTAIRASIYYALYERPNVTYLDATGSERREILDGHFVGDRSGFDWDAEVMGQGGRVGGKQIGAWATGARVGYTIAPSLSTRVGLQLDTASGDRHPNDGTIQTFNPLFPNGYYFTLAGDTGYSNLVHVKPSITQKLTRDLLATAALGFQWRESTTDAVYLHPMTALPGTAGAPGAWTGSYFQIRTETKFGPSMVIACELVHFEAGHAIRSVGGGNSDYVGFEGKLSW